MKSRRRITLTVLLAIALAFLEPVAFTLAPAIANQAAWQLFSFVPYAFVSFVEALANGLFGVVVSLPFVVSAIGVFLIWRRR